MQLGPDEAAAAVERHPCPQCTVPAGSACRTRAGKTAAKYHTARFILVPSLRDELTVAAVSIDHGDTMLRDQLSEGLDRLSPVERLAWSAIQFCRYSIKFVLGA